MTEGSEVHLITKYLDNELCGRIVDTIKLADPSIHRERVPGPLQIEHLFPAFLEEVSCRGKVIYFAFMRVKYNLHMKFYLVSHLGTSGRWIWKNEGHATAWLEFDDLYPTLYFDDTQHNGNLKIYHDHDIINGGLSGIGPDLMATALMYYQRPVVSDSSKPSEITYVSGPVISDPVTPEVWIEKFRNPRLRNKKIGIFLTEQRHFSGIGKCLRNEIFARSKIGFDRALGSLSHADLETLYRITLQTMLLSYLIKGSTIESYWDPNGNRGIFFRPESTPPLSRSGHPKRGLEAIRSYFGYPNASLKS